MSRLRCECGASALYACDAEGCGTRMCITHHTTAEGRGHFCSDHTGGQRAAPPAKSPAPPTVTTEWVSRSTHERHYAPANVGDLVYLAVDSDGARSPIEVRLKLAEVEGEVRIPAEALLRATQGMLAVGPCGAPYLSGVCEIHGTRDWRDGVCGACRPAENAK